MHERYQVVVNTVQGPSPMDAIRIIEQFPENWTDELTRAEQGVIWGMLEYLGNRRNWSEAR